MTLRNVLRFGAWGCLAAFIAAIYLHSQLALVGSFLVGIALAIASMRLQASIDERKQLHALAEAHLEPGEIVEAAFMATSGPGPYLMLIAIVFSIPLSLLLGGRDGTALARFWDQFTTLWSIIVTDRAILLFKRIPEPRADVLQARLPRYTRFGPVSGWFAMIELNGTEMFVRGRFHAAVELSDRLIETHQFVEPANS